jgi:HEAT repeat protein
MFEARMALSGFRWFPGAALLSIAAVLFVSASRARGEGAPRDSLEARVERLTRGLEDPDWEVRKRTTRALVGFGDTVLPRAFRLLASPDPEVRSRAASVILAFRESPLLWREAFRSGPVGTGWAFRMAANADARLPPGGRFHLREVVRAAGAYGVDASIPFVVDAVVRGVPGAGDALALLGSPERCFRECRKRYSPSGAGRILPAMGRTGGAEAGAFLRALVREGDPLERRLARSALEEHARTRRALGMARILLSKSALARREARRRLREEPAWFRDRVADATLRAMGDRDPETVVRNLDAPWAWDGVDPRLLSFRRGGRLLETWIRRLRGAAPETRADWIFKVVAEYPWVPAATGACTDRIVRTADGIEAWKALIPFGGFAAIPLGKRLAAADSPPAPGWGRLLAALGGAPAMEAFEEILLRGRRETAVPAARALAEQGGEGALALLLRGAEREEVRSPCIALLSSKGKEVGFDRLAVFLTASPPPELLEGLGRTGDPRARDVLYAALAERRLRHGALRGLGHLGGDDVLPTLARAAFGRDTWKSALAGLALLGDERALPFLERYGNGCRVLGLHDRARIARSAAARIRGRR